MTYIGTTYSGPDVLVFFPCNLPYCAPSKHDLCFNFGIALFFFFFVNGFFFQMETIQMQSIYCVCVCVCENMQSGRLFKIKWQCNTIKTALFNITDLATHVDSLANTINPFAFNHIYISIAFGKENKRFIQFL